MFGLIYFHFLLLLKNKHLSFNLQDNNILLSIVFIIFSILCFLNLFLICHELVLNY